MSNIKQRIILIIAAAFLLIGCSDSKRMVAPIYKKEIRASNANSYEEFKKTAGNKVYFTFDSSLVSKVAEKILIKQAEWLKANPNTVADIEGYCDEIGTEEYNFALGLRRAQSVKNFLAKRRVEQERLNIISYGKLNPEKLGHN